MQGGSQAKRSKIKKRRFPGQSQTERSTKRGIGDARLKSSGTLEDGEEKVSRPESNGMFDDEI
jgi:hypothetical protein